MGTKIYPTERHQQIQNSLRRKPRKKPALFRALSHSFIAIPFKHLVVKPLKWVVYKPLYFLIIEPGAYVLNSVQDKSSLPANSSGTRTKLGTWLYNFIERLPGEAFIDDLAHIFNEFGFFKLSALVLGTFGVFTIWQDLSERQKLNIYQAWDIINSASDVSADGGRSYAIRDLYRNNQTLNGLDVSGATLTGINVAPECTWRRCSEIAQVSEANFQETLLRSANFQSAYLVGANFKKSKLRSVIFEGSFLMDADFQDAFIAQANLNEAYLIRANLRGAYLRLTTFNKTIILGSNLSEVKDLEEDQLENAYLCATIFPEHIKTSSDRDCEDLPSLLVRNSNLRRSFDVRTEANVRELISHIRSQVP